MKHKLLCFATLLLMLACSVRLSAQYYDTGIDSTRWIQLSDNAVTIADSSTSESAFGPYAIGFPFQFGAEQHTQFSTNKYGFIKFGNTCCDGGAWDVSLAENAPGVTTSDDIRRVLLLTKYIKYELFGTTPNRVLVCEYHRYERYNHSDRIEKYQIQFFESSNLTCIVYDTMNTFSGSIGASIGASNGAEYFYIDNNNRQQYHTVITNHPAPEQYRYYEFRIPAPVIDGDLTYRDSTRSVVIKCNPNATSINIPNTVEEIAPFAFENCTNLASVTLPNSVATIGNSAFASCTNLSTLTIGSNDNASSSVATTIGDSAFAECANLANISWKDNITSMGNYVFAGCSVMARLVMPDSTVSIGDRCFNGCTNLRSITFGQRLASCGHLSNTLDSITLDTLRFRNPNPIYYSNNYIYASLGRLRTPHPVIIVPCGALPEYRSTPANYSGGYGAYGTLMSECSSVVITPVATDTGIVIVPSWCKLPYEIVRLSDGTLRPNKYDLGPYCFEPGEVVEMRGLPIVHTDIYYHFDLPYQTDVMIDYWSNGTMGNSTTFTAEESDTLVGYVIHTPYAVLDTNNVHAPIKAFGSMARIDNKAQYSFLNDTTPTIYSTGLWISGLNNDTIFVAADKYSRLSDGMDYQPGPYQEGAATMRWDSLSWNHVWKVGRNEIDYHLSHVGHTDYEMPDDLANWPGPFVDTDGDSIYSPLLGDYPLIRGDQATFGIFNDNKSHDLSLGMTMGLEIHIMAYAFSDTSEALNNTVFVNYKIYNKSNRTYSDCYLNMFTDFDLGYRYDDFVGCDVKRGLTFAYNGDESDGPGEGSFPGIPPAQGMTILGGARLQADGADNPKVDIDKMRAYYPSELQQYVCGDGYDTLALTRDADRYYPNAWNFTPGDTLGNNSINGLNFGNGIADDERYGMTNHMFYINSADGVSGEPSKATDYYNYSRSYWKNRQHLRYGGNGVNYGITDFNCNFMFPHDSDPLHWGTDGMMVDDWTEITAGNCPSDRRTVAGSGPFTFLPGEMQELDLAYISAKADEGIAYSSVELLKKYTDDIRNMFIQDTTTSGKAFTYIPTPGSTIDIKEAEEKPRILLYPNPTMGMVTIEANIPNNQTIKIFNTLGAEVLQYNITNERTILDLRSLPNGIYYLRCNGTTSKIIKH